MGDGSVGGRVDGGYHAAAAASASRATLLFPTPAAPETTIPATSAPDSAASMIRISSEGPVNGHAKRTSGA